MYFYFYILSHIFLDNFFKRYHILLNLVVLSYPFVWYLILWFVIRLLC